jgi:hypothetical protein
MDEDNMIAHGILETHWAFDQRKALAHATLMRLMSRLHAEIMGYFRHPT